MPEIFAIQRETLVSVQGLKICILGLRGLRTLRLRLEQSAANGLAVATAIKDHSLVNAMLHPAMADSPDNEIYQRDFSGPCGLFGVVIDGNIAQSAIDKAVEEMGISRNWRFLGAAMKA